LLAAAEVLVTIRLESVFIALEQNAVGITGHDHRPVSHLDRNPRPQDLACRTKDSTGQTQPETPEWNCQGIGNHDIQRLTVTYRQEPVSR
jgi:hypothetical protein